MTGPVQIHTTDQAVVQKLAPLEREYMDEQGVVTRRGVAELF